MKQSDERSGTRMTEKKSINNYGLIESLRKIGKEKGFWSNGFGYKHQCNQIFQKIDFHGRSMLEIGCGKGIFCVWASIHGAKHVVGLEPLVDGSFDTTKCYQGFDDIRNQLQLNNIEMLSYRLQDYKCMENYFDIVLSVASINHLDEESCIHIRESIEARKAYLSIFQHINKIMKNNGKLIIIDASNRNFFSDIRVENPFTPSVEWSKHQSPEYWVKLLSECGFIEPKISWLSGRILRYLGKYTINKAISYYIDSYFRLEMRCRK